MPTTYISDLQVLPDIDSKKIWVQIGVVNGLNLQNFDIELKVLRTFDGSIKKLLPVQKTVPCDSVIQLEYSISEDMENKGIIPELPKVPLISPTDSRPLANNKYNVVTLIGLNQGVVSSNYHRIDDTFDKLDISLLQKSADIVESIILNYI